MEMSILQKLVDAGAVYVDGPDFHADRAKVMGRMWGGSAQLELKKMQFFFQLWHHGADKETLDTLKPYFRLRGIRTLDRYYDCGWYTIVTEEGIWLHKKGWFGLSEDALSLKEHPLIKRIGNHLLNRPVYTKKEQTELRKLGFKLVVKF